MWLEELLLAQHVVGQWSRNLSRSWFQVQSYPQPKRQRAAGNKGPAYIKGFTAFLNIIHQPRPVLGQHFMLQVNSNLHNFVPRVSHFPTPWSERGDEDPMNEVATCGLWFWFGGKSAYSIGLEISAALFLFHFSHFMPDLFLNFDSYLNLAVFQRY